MVHFRQLALDAEVDVNCINNSQGFTPLLLLCSSNKSDSLFHSIQSLLERSTLNVNARDKEGWGALSYLCLFNDKNSKFPDIIQQLFDKGMEISVTSSQEWETLSQTALNLSLYHSNYPHVGVIIRQLLEMGIKKLNTTISNKKQSNLHLTR